MLKFTHNDIEVGEKIRLAHRNPAYKVLDIVDGWRGIKVQRAFGTQTDPMWVDIEEVVGKFSEGI